MKTKNLLTIALIASSVAIFSSCSEDDDHADDGCQECHIAMDMNGTEMMWEITNAAGGEEFCGDELDDAESNNFVYTVAAGDSLVCTMGGHVLYAGDYGPGSTDSIGALYEIHCEEHQH